MPKPRMTFTPARNPIEITSAGMAIGESRSTTIGVVNDGTLELGVGDARFGS